MSRGGLRWSEENHAEWREKEVRRELDEAKTIGKPLRLEPSVEPESSVLSNVLTALLNHPKVAKVWRQNTGAGQFVYPGGEKSRFLRFGFKGSPDIHGYLRGGRACYCEVKRLGEELTPEQAAFLENAREAGCIAFVARGVDDVFRELEQA